MSCPFYKTKITGFLKNLSLRVFFPKDLDGIKIDFNFAKDDFVFKGTVPRDLRWVLLCINQKLFLRPCIKFYDD